MTTDLGPWVGVLDLDQSEGETAGFAGLASAGYAEARLLVRIHGAPVGHVSIPVQPENSLDSRARATAVAELADMLRLHESWDLEFDKMAGRAEWAARLACPQRSVLKSGAGISVIICTRDRPVLLADCLIALQQVNYHPIEFVVVDNAPSDDATRNVVAEFAATDPRIRYSCEPRPGLSRARNHGIKVAQFDVLAFTDDDVIVDPAWPAALVAGFVSDPDAVCVTGLVATRSLDAAAERYFDSRYSWGEAFQPRRYDLAEHRDQSRLYPFTAGIFGVGANFAIRRDVVARLGGFDALLGAGAPGRGGEDLDMFVRIILTGHRICYAPAALAWHRHRSSNQALAHQVFSYGWGLGAYLAKRLRTGEMSIAFLLRATGYSAVIFARMRRASEVSRLTTRGKRLALSEMLGVFAGALCYYRVAWRKREQ
ncbi:MAG: glycosyltransferase family 2 protein [Streptosporangiaceae bacterium]